METLEFAHTCQLGRHGGTFDLPADLKKAMDAARSRGASQRKAGGGSGAGGGDADAGGDGDGGDKVRVRGLCGPLRSALVMGRVAPVGTGSSRAGAPGGSAATGGCGRHDTAKLGGAEVMEAPPLTGLCGTVAAAATNHRAPPLPPPFLPLQAQQCDEALLQLVSETFDSGVKTLGAMRQMGIAHTADTPVGDAMLRGVSGGERKRVTLAEMLVRPAGLGGGGGEGGCVQLFRGSGALMLVRAGLGGGEGGRGGGVRCRVCAGGGARSSPC